MCLLLYFFETECRQFSAEDRSVNDYCVCDTLFSINECFCSALETLIRAKYEQKKYIDKDWKPPQLAVSLNLYTVTYLEVKGWSSQLLYIATCREPQTAVVYTLQSEVGY